MKVTIDGVGELRFWFQRNIRVTACTCQIGDGDGGRQMWRQSSHCARGDVFVKATGRRVALNKLLHFMTLQHRMSGPTSTYADDARRNRGLIWAEYFRVHADLKK